MSVKVGDTVYVTKWALSKGIRVETISCVDHACDGVTLRDWFPVWFYAPDWHETLEAAQLHVSIMREKRIKSLEKQLAKLRAMKEAKVVER